MAFYTYVSNVSPADGFDRIDIPLDNGQKTTIRRGRSYDLSATEVARARRYVVMASSPSGDLPGPVGYLPVKGNMADGQVPVWSASEGAFIPGSGGGGGGGSGSSNAEAYVWNGSTYVLASTPVRFFFGPTDPSSVSGFTMRDFDNWTPTQAPS